MDIYRSQIRRDLLRSFELYGDCDEIINTGNTQIEFVEIVAGSFWMEVLPMKLSLFQRGFTSRYFDPNHYMQRWKSLSDSF